MTDSDARRRFALTSMRKFFTRWSAVLACFALVALFVYAGYVEPRRLEITQTQIGEPPGEKAIVIAQISDLHLQEVGNLERSVLRRVQEIEPDLLVLSGDVIDKQESLAQLDVFLTGLNAPLKIAVLGNWEYWSGVDLKRLEQLYKDHGVELLVNASAQYTVKGRALDVHGVDDYTAGNPRINIIEGKASELSVLLQHSPGFFQEDLSFLGRLTLCISGHTHGGQMTLFGWPIWTPRGSGEYVKGLYQTKTCPMYVSRGVGTSLLGFRIGARPEIAVFAL